MSDASEQRHWAGNEPELSGRSRDWEVEGVKGICRSLESVWEGALGGPGDQDRRLSDMWGRGWVLVPISESHGVRMLNLPPGQCGVRR